MDKQGLATIEQRLRARCGAVAMRRAMTKDEKVQLLRTQYPAEFRQLALVGCVLHRERRLLNIDTVARLAGMDADDVRTVAWLYGSKGHKLLPIRYYKNKVKTVENLKWGGAQ